MMLSNMMRFRFDFKIYIFWYRENFYWVFPWMNTMAYQWYKTAMLLRLANEELFWLTTHILHAKSGVHTGRNKCYVLLLASHNRRMNFQNVWIRSSNLIFLWLASQQKQKIVPCGHRFT